MFESCLFPLVKGCLCAIKCHFWQPLHASDGLEVFDDQAVTPSLNKTMLKKELVAVKKAGAKFIRSVPSSPFPALPAPIAISATDLQFLSKMHGGTNPSFLAFVALLRPHDISVLKGMVEHPDFKGFLSLGINPPAAWKYNGLS